MTEGSGRRSSTGTHLFRILPVLLILVLALVFLAPAVFKSCLPEPESFTLESMCELWDIQFEAHDAMNDARATLELATLMLRKD